MKKFITLAVCLIACSVLAIQLNAQQSRVAKSNDQSFHAVSMHAGPADVYTYKIFQAPNKLYGYLMHRRWRKGNLQRKLLQLQLTNWKIILLRFLIRRKLKISFPNKFSKTTIMKKVYKLYIAFLNLRRQKTLMSFLKYSVFLTF